MKNIFLCVIVLTLAGACSVKHDESVNEATTQVVLDHHMKAFQANDLDGIMADYSEESVLIQQSQTSKGLAEIRKVFEGAFTVFPKDSTTMKINKSVVVQDAAYVVWDADAPKAKVSFGSDTFIIKNGKIVLQTVALP